jgi:hypothetical protein
MVKRRVEMPSFNKVERGKQGLTFPWLPTHWTTPNRPQSAQRVDTMIPVANSTAQSVERQPLMSLNFVNAAVNIFVHLRQMKPDLKPWEWNRGIWPTNSMLPDGTLLGGGIFHHAKPVVAFENSTTSLVEPRKCYMTWYCTACKMDHRMNVPLNTLTLLGAGLLDREGWASYMNGSSRDPPIVMTIVAKPSFLLGNGATIFRCRDPECQDLIHLCSEADEDRRQRTCRQQRIGTKCGC